jgi:DNA modification methylase
MWTDPPYGVDYVGKTADAMTIQNDGADSSVVLGAMRMASSALRPSAPFYIAHPAGPRASVFARIVEEVGWRVHQQLVWVKDSMVLGHSDYHYQHEPILYGYTSGDGRPGRGNHVGSKWYGDNAQVSVLAVDRPKRNADHPTSKPVELVRRCIRNSTRLADVVYDPFLGSGTTLIACETEGRRCFGLEIEPKYVDVIVARWEKISGGEAILDGSDGLTFAKVRAGRLEQWQDEVMEEAVR